MVWSSIYLWDIKHNLRCHHLTSIFLEIPAYDNAESGNSNEVGMYCEIISFAFIESKKLYVEFEDGKKGLFDMSKYITSDFFSALNNQAYFKRAFLQYGVLTWPEGQDISPETIKLEMVPYHIKES